MNIERIGRNDNFYLSGGDSLLIAQVIARMRETIEAAKRWSWDDLLKEMMKTPTIRGVAKIKERMFLVLHCLAQVYLTKKRRRYWLI